MTNSAKGSTDVSWQRLWLTLTGELTAVFDAHFICATVAAEVAVFSGCTTLVGISDEERQHYDVWIAEADGTILQTKWAAERATFDPILDSFEAARLTKFERPVSELVNSELWLLAEEEILAVPLPLPNENGLTAAPGVLCLLDPGPDGELAVSTLTELSRGLTVYLDRAALRRQVDQQEVEFAVISDISSTLTSTLSMEHVFQELAGTIRRTLQVESLSVGLSEAHTGDIVFASSMMGSQFESMPEIRVRLGQGIAGWVAEHGETVLINDTYADKRFYAGPDRQSGFRTRSMICIPLQVAGETIGVLQAINRRYGKFTNHDLQLLQAIGGPLAAAITNSRLHADVLAEKRRVETIFTSMSDGLLAVSTDGTITRANDALCALLQVEENELLGRQAAQVVRLLSGNIAGFIAQLSASSEEGEQTIAELQRDNGRPLPVLISGSPIYDDHGDVRELILTFSDLSQIREVERMREDLFQAIAHELRTPLATILMYARLLREGKATDEEKAARFLGVIERESDRLQNMVRRMMQLAKMEATELQRSSEPVALTPILEDLVPPLADLALQKGLTFRKNIEPGLPLILGEPERLEEIIRNLVTNAIKFTPSGTVRLDVGQQDDRVIITVSDQGIGIPRQALPNLFKRFYRAQTAVERGIAGTGLGLYMVKQSVEHYNGTITVTSIENEGTTFIVSFPVYEL
jgi:PAS domain S-box-containing protein